MVCSRRSNRLSPLGFRGDSKLQIDPFCFKANYISVLRLDFKAVAESRLSVTRLVDVHLVGMAPRVGLRTREQCRLFPTNAKWALLAVEFNRRQSIRKLNVKSCHHCVQGNP